MKNVILLASLMVFFAGCSTNMGTLSFASTGSVPIETKKGDYIYGEDCLFYLFGIPLGNTTNRLTLAMANAVENAAKAGVDADALQNVTIDYSSWSALLFGGDCYKIRGQAVEVKSGGGTTIHNYNSSAN